MTQTLLDSIHENISQLIQSEYFDLWLRPQSINRDDVVIINNSTLLRDLSKTAKSQKYLSLQIKNPNPFSFQTNIIHFPEKRRKNIDFDVLSAKDPMLAGFKTEPLSVAIEDELDHLGKLVFVLIGCLDQSKIFEVPISHSHFSKLIYNPRLTKPVQMIGPEIHIKDSLDADFIFDELRSQISREDAHDQEFLQEFKQPLNNAVNQLKKDAYTSLTLPQSEKDFDNCFLDRFVGFYRRELERYQNALTDLSNEKTNSSAMNEILRIAYTFDEEIYRMLRLFFNLCDIKPVVFWASLHAQFALLVAFDGLSSDLSKAKLSLQDYSKMIHGARNRAFHGVLDFNQDIEAVLEGINIKAYRLRIFSEYKSKGNLFDYEDREIVDALTAFTRPSEKYVQSDFWTKNYRVLTAFTDLVAAVSTALKSLFVTQNNQNI